MKSYQYTKSMINWYDRLMDSDLFDYRSPAKAISSIMGKRERILELGIGTGLLAEKLVEKGFNVTGVDCSREMLLHAKERLANRVGLFEQDVLELNIPEKYEAAVSYGGMWYCTRKGMRVFLESHLLEQEDNLEGLTQVASHLVPKGLLLIGIRWPHMDISRFPLKNRATCSIRTHHQGNIIHKSYYVKLNGKIAAYQHLILRRFTKKEERQLMHKAGFKERGPDRTRHFYVWEKR